MAGSRVGAKIGTIGSAWANHQRLFDKIGSAKMVGPALDALAPISDPFFSRCPNLKPWFTYGIYGLVRDGKTVFVGQSSKPIFAVAEHAIPAPAWMGFISYDHAWVRPSHPDRAQHDIRQFHKDNPDGIPA
jgi:hypothetical protein